MAAGEIYTEENKHMIYKFSNKHTQIIHEKKVSLTLVFLLFLNRSSRTAQL